jgi:hypothetical protein
MISTQQLQLNIVKAYIAHVQELYADEPHEVSRLILVLQIYEWQLRRYRLKKAATLDQLGTLKHGIRTAELILEDVHDNEPQRMQGWFFGCSPKNEAQRLCSLLWQIVVSLTREIVEVERMHHAMKPQFDEERARYRHMKQEAETS